MALQIELFPNRIRQLEGSRKDFRLLVFTLVTNRLHDLTGLIWSLAGGKKKIKCPRKGSGIVHSKFK